MLVKSSVSRGRAANEQTRRRRCGGWVNRWSKCCGSPCDDSNEFCVTKSPRLQCDEITAWRVNSVASSLYPVTVFVTSSLFGEKVNSSLVTSSPCDEFTVSQNNRSLHKNDSNSTQNIFKTTFSKSECQNSHRYSWITLCHMLTIGDVLLNDNWKFDYQIFLSFSFSWPQRLIIIFKHCRHGGPT